MATRSPRLAPSQKPSFRAALGKLDNFSAKLTASLSLGCLKSGNQVAASSVDFPIAELAIEQPKILGNSVLVSIPLPEIR